MKKVICMMVLMMAMSFCVSCGTDKIETGSTEASETTEKQAAEKGSSSSSAAGGVDLDLTVMSSTMVYSEVYNITVAPEEYIGNIVRMKGEFATQVDPESGKRYFACIIKDATACCAQGIEFVPSENYSYPEDFPEDGAEVTVTGEFRTYDENRRTYCHLIDAVFE